jgi:hypothetical protein
MKRGGFVVIALFPATIVSTALLHQLLHLSPFLGMMTGLGVLKLYGFSIPAGGAARLLATRGSGQRSIQSLRSLTYPKTRCQVLRHLRRQKADGMGYLDVLLWRDAVRYLALVSISWYALL